ncbi:MAG: hypothetical protein M3N12_07700, partial [Verrucomicrobiota bacterium]|nr:hypothetical protein [Verrucomicrobiota bacterium]
MTQLQKGNMKTQMMAKSEASKLIPHWAALEFRPLEGQDYEDFKESIRLLGVRTPIVISGDIILDGRNRARAAIELDVDLP